MHNQFQQQKYPGDSHQLDLEFRQILSVIKQFIPYVDSNSHLSLYRSWLEKLSSTNSDKTERNRYLLELARQIKENSVFPPFDQRPPIGHLKTFPEVDSYVIDDSKVKANNVHLRYPNFSLQMTGEFNNIPQPMLSSPLKKPNNFPRPYKTNNDMSEPPTTYPFETNKFYVPQLHEMKQAYNDNNFNSREPKFYLHNERKAIINAPQDISGSCDVTAVERDDNHAVPTKGNAASKNGVHEDSSWCDLTDTSTTSIVAECLGRGDAMERVAAAGNEPHEVVQDDTIDITSKSPDEVDTKFPLKDTHFISADWKKTIESLQMRLTETLNENNELKSVIQALKAKSNYESSNKEQTEMKQKMTAEVHAKEMEMLRKTKSEQLRKLERSYEFQIEQIEDNYKLKMEEIKADSEMRLRELKLEYEDDKKEKDKEIYRLSDIIQQQCIRMSNEIAALRKQIENSMPCNNNHNHNHNNVPEEKVFVLKKCVSKMDKLFHKSEKDYMKQIEKLKQELELKDKVAQIQLRTQRAELISRTNADRQNQIEEIVNNLEVKYIKMLEFHENQVSESKRQDEEKIEHLKELLEKNNIPSMV
ncbi:unnamed protein product [Phaedon cochleariae]|uniref:DUF4485 domain-containing protein n=1 Tax=Phaedon cochleariae TaxID=80249 RepID=A0A9P0GTX3_PHACE|nr:unnamed protein product [Phaedon cochleariae]